MRGGWDSILHIAVHAASFLPNPEEKVALEIGHGGGRLLAVASGSFSSVIGLDTHRNNERVERNLKDRGIDNYRLLEASGREVPLPNESIDFAYSFIVLQHVEKYETFLDYLREAQRVLKPGGLAVLYFGRKCSFVAEPAVQAALPDGQAHRALSPSNGFQELSARVNCINLIVSLSHATRLAKGIGFEVLGRLVSHRKSGWTEPVSGPERAGSSE